MREAIERKVWRHVGVIVLAAAGAWLASATSRPARAADPPHWSSASADINCTSQCHVAHQGAGGALTQSAENVNLCQSCHVGTGLARDLPVDSADRATPGSSGVHHGFDVAAVHPGLNTQLPLDPQMALRVMNGNVVCSTCHDQHESNSTFGGSTRVGNAAKIQSDTGTGVLASGGEYTGSVGVWYLVDIVTSGDETSAVFRYSKDNGTSWFPEQTAGTDVPLDSGVTVSFGPGTYVTAEQWEFTASWQFLRASLGPGGAGMCGDCHRDWVMDHNAVEIWNGGAVKSHPVGVSLGVNGRGYDRTDPLDGNGAAQNPPGASDVDGNPTNDLELFDSPSDVVQCLTCHGVHYVDSNTQTVDGP